MAGLGMGVGVEKSKMVDEYGHQYNIVMQFLCHNSDALSTFQVSCHSFNIKDLQTGVRVRVGD